MHLFYSAMQHIRSVSGVEWKCFLVNLIRENWVCGTLRKLGLWYPAKTFYLSGELLTFVGRSFQYAFVTQGCLDEPIMRVELVGRRSIWLY